MFYCGMIREKGVKMETLALWIGYMIIALIAFIFIYAFYQWALYGEVVQITSSEICGGNVYINGKLVAELKGDGNISTVNGSVYHNGKLIYKHKKKFRWEK